MKRNEPQRAQKDLASLVFLANSNPKAAEGSKESFEKGAGGQL
jgi:hypothetical protein